MSFFRLLLLGLLGYWGYRLFKNYFTGGKSGTEIKGESRSKPLDLNDADVEDAKFEDIKDE